MQVLIVYAHPEPTSFNGALRDAAVEAIRAAGDDVVVSDLYAEAFDPVAGRHDFTAVADPDRFHYQSEQLAAARAGAFAADIAREQERLQRADLVILQFPLWWGAPPAILKGWFDRVLAYGVAYMDGRRFERGLFRQRGGMMCVTAGGTDQRFSAAGEYGEIERVLWPVRHLTLDYLGLAVEEPFVCYATPRADAAMRENYLRQWQARVRTALGKDFGRNERSDADTSARDANPTTWSSAV
jgi:NAD(P)H dehydrogenase (quinone)